MACDLQPSWQTPMAVVQHPSLDGVTRLEMGRQRKLSTGKN
jgi:hypothetical protein